MADKKPYKTTRFEYIRDEPVKQAQAQVDDKKVAFKPRQPNEPRVSLKELKEKKASLLGAIELLDKNVSPEHRQPLRQAITMSLALTNTFFKTLDEYHNQQQTRRDERYERKRLEREVVEAFFKQYPSGFDKQGYDQKGYNRLGYDKNGFNEEGKDKNGFSVDEYDDGYDPRGFDKNGYNKDGYDWRGYNKERYNKDGYDWRGYGKDGYNKDGFDEHGFDRNGVEEDGYNEETPPKPKEPLE